ncbi:MAG: SRPBCC domain-containing protein [Balneolaceae bacterium]|nr:SRPBCC domain-containing protein [Balneolaceae bacterium]
MNMRIDSASRFISASPKAIYQAFAESDAIERWIPPNNMTGKMLHFDFREGGSYRIRLTYTEPGQGHGKTSKDYDEVEVRITKLEDEQRIEQEITFESEEPAFTGIMRMIWTFQYEENGTLVSVRAENVPEGIRPKDHQTGLNSSLENLAIFVETESSDR